MLYRIPPLAIEAETARQELFAFQILATSEIALNRMLLVASRQQIDESRALLGRLAADRTERAIAEPTQTSRSAPGSARESNFVVAAAIRTAHPLRKRLRYKVGAMKSVAVRCPQCNALGYVEIEPMLAGRAVECIRCHNGSSLAALEWANPTLAGVLQVYREEQIVGTRREHARPAIWAR
jgi:hypothetical protein